MGDPGACRLDELMRVSTVSMKERKLSAGETSRIFLTDWVEKWEESGTMPGFVN